MNLYEMTYVLRPDLDEDALKAAQDRINGRLNDAGGEVVRSEGWGRRRLAYPIDKAKDGLYFTAILRMPGVGLRGFEDQLKLTPEILRFLVIRQQEANIPKTGSLIPTGQGRPARPPVEVAAPEPAEGETAALDAGTDAATNESASEETPAVEGEPASEVAPDGASGEASPVDAPVQEERASVEAAAGETEAPSGETEAPSETAPGEDRQQEQVAADEPTTAEQPSEEAGGTDATQATADSELDEEGK